MWWFVNLHLDNQSTSTLGWRWMLHEAGDTLRSWYWVGSNFISLEHKPNRRPLCVLDSLSCNLISMRWYAEPPSADHQDGCWPWCFLLTCVFNWPIGGEIVPVWANAFSWNPRRSTESRQTPVRRQSCGPIATNLWSVGYRYSNPPTWPYLFM